MHLITVVVCRMLRHLRDALITWIHDRSGKRRARYQFPRRGVATGLRKYQQQKCRPRIQSHTHMQRTEYKEKNFICLKITEIEFAFRLG